MQGSFPRDHGVKPEKETLRENEEVPQKPGKDNLVGSGEGCNLPRLTRGPTGSTTDELVVWTETMCPLATAAADLWKCSSEPKAVSFLKIKLSET